MTANLKPFVLFDDALTAEGGAFLFRSPERIIVCDDPKRVNDSFDAIAGALAGGRFAAGVFAYELGYLLELKLAPLLPPLRSEPLLWVGIFPPPIRMTRDECTRWIDACVAGDEAVTDLAASLDRAAYRDAFARVQEAIRAGDVYQINMTLKVLFRLTGDPMALYRRLRREQPVASGGVIADEDFDLLSLSPELFLRLAGGVAEARPMKGTVARGLTTAADDAARAWLGRDIKSRAENLMIVDLLRNDLGRLAEIGGVSVTDLFSVETYRTVHAMTSGISARLRPGTGFRDLLKGLFPCGSVTGAPKIRAMEIIRELEAGPRGFYTGAMGWFAPNGDAWMNVAIRTLVVRPDGRGEMGIGSGVVADSGCDAEYDECLLKAAFLTRPPTPRFALFETLRWDRGGGYVLIDRHLDRLAGSARYFAFPFDRVAAREVLADQTERFVDPCYRVRLHLNETGEMTVSAEPLRLPARLRDVTFVLSDRAVSSRDVFLYHKTTERRLYESEFERLTRESGCDEVVFVNERGELTEGSRANLFVRRGETLLTPPVGCGLLAGTLRRDLLEAGEGRVIEAVLTPDDLAAADGIFLGNSVRGLQRARLIK